MVEVAVGFKNHDNLMEYKEITQVGAKISRLGFGGCALGGHGWGKSDEDLLRDSIRKAIDCGVTLFDTADIYGLGKSEKLLGEELQSIRDEVVITTKFGVRRDNLGTFYDCSSNWI